MFDNSLFSITDIEKNDEKYFVQILFDAQHEIFHGHFPEKKVVPGVMLMQMVKEVSHKILNLKDSFITDADMKFLNPVLVDESDKLNLELAIEELGKNTFKVKSVGKNKEKKYFKINIILI